jgi:hypothetical protein
VINVFISKSSLPIFVIGSNILNPLLFLNNLNIMKEYNCRTTYTCNTNRGTSNIPVLTCSVFWMQNDYDSNMFYESQIQWILYRWNNLDIHGKVTCYVAIVWLLFTFSLKWNLISRIVSLLHNRYDSGGFFSMLQSANYIRNNVSTTFSFSYELLFK